MIKSLIYYNKSDQITSDILPETQIKSLVIYYHESDHSTSYILLQTQIKLLVIYYRKLCSDH